jgi:hypothetical protein
VVTEIGKRGCHVITLSDLGVGQNRHNRTTSLADRGIGVCEALDADAEEE